MQHIDIIEKIFDFHESSDQIRLCPLKILITIFKIN